MLAGEGRCRVTEFDCRAKDHALLSGTGQQIRTGCLRRPDVDTCRGFQAITTACLRPAGTWHLIVDYLYPSL